jgi:hypothetical protein
MRLIRIAVTLLGLAGLAVGILWIGQGTGYIPWPSSSFMIDQMPWAYAGAALGLAGLVAMFLARRIR